jgi:hypothetical protein
LLDEASVGELIPRTPNLYNLASKLAEIIPLKHEGVQNEGPDILHGRWAEALMTALYCGCTSQQKAVRPECGNYEEIRDLIEQTIVAAFKEGVKYAPERERRSHDIVT